MLQLRIVWVPTTRELTVRQPCMKELYDFYKNNISSYYCYVIITTLFTTTTPADMDRYSTDCMVENVRLWDDFNDGIQYLKRARKGAGEGLMTSTGSDRTWAEWLQTEKGQALIIC